MCGKEFFVLKKTRNQTGPFTSPTIIEKFSTYTMLTDIAKHMDNAVSQKAQNGRFQAGARRVMACLAIKNGLSQMELIHATHFKAPTISMLVQKLEQEGIIVRKSDDLDMRLTHVYLTEKGWDVYKEMYKEIRSVENDAFDSFTEDEREEFRRLILRAFYTIHADDFKSVSKH